MSDQPLALEWLCFLRDCGQDLKLTLGERALASLLPTYGQGKNIYVSTVTLSKITGWSRTTVRKARDGLIAKGLLEDITGDPDKQLRTYRLAMPGYVTEPGTVGGRETTLLSAEPGQILTSPGQILTTPDQNLTTPWPGSDHNIKPLDQEVDLQLHHHHADGGVAEDLSSQSQDRAEDGPSSAPGSLIPVLDPDVLDGVIVSGSSGEIDWDDPAVRQHLAGALGMEPGEIWSSTWAWLKGLHLGPEHAAAVDAAAQRSAGAKTPIAPFRGHLAECLPRAGEFRAERQSALAEETRIADEERKQAEEEAKAEQERQEKAERDRLEREQAQAEFDRLVPELVALGARYDPRNKHPASAEIGDANRHRDPHDKLREIRKSIDWYQGELAERERRAPLAARCLKHITTNPGTGDAELADALGADPDEVHRAVDDLRNYTPEPPIRRTWNRDATTGRHRDHYYLTGE